MLCANPTNYGYTRLREYLDGEERLTVTDQLVIAAKLTKCLDALHSSEFTLGNLNIDNVFVKFIRSKVFLIFY